MALLLKDRVTAVWLALVAATLVSVWLGTDHGFDDPEVAGAAVLVVAFVKVRFVGMWFMELRRAPVALRLLFEGYVLVVLGVVLGFYLS